MKTVACPCCAEPCSLLKLHRGGNYRLMDAGGSHAPVCPGLARRPVPVRYRPRGSSRFAALKAGAA